MCKSHNHIYQNHLRSPDCLTLVLPRQSLNFYWYINELTRTWFAEALEAIDLVNTDTHITRIGETLIDIDLTVSARKAVLTSAVIMSLIAGAGAVVFTLLQET